MESPDNNDWIIQSAVEIVEGQSSQQWLIIRILERALDKLYAILHIQDNAGLDWQHSQESIYFSAISKFRRTMLSSERKGAISHEQIVANQRKVQEYYTSIGANKNLEEAMWWRAEASEEVKEDIKHRRPHRSQPTHEQIEEWRRQAHEFYRQQGIETR